MISSRPRFLLLLTLLALAGTLHAQEASTLEQQMGSADFQQSGLNKLSPQELAHLQKWLGTHAPELAAAIPASEATSAAVAANGKPAKDSWFDRLRNHESKGGVPNNTVVSQIAGSFKGWGPGTTLTLQNGQKWRVADASSLSIYKPLDNPEVTIKPGMVGGWIMKVKGYNTSAQVQPAN